jgi:hypothetical protein
MNPRLVVIANLDGADTVVSDGTAPRSHDFANPPGFAQTLIWTTSPNPTRSFDRDVANTWGPSAPETWRTDASRFRGVTTEAPAGTTSSPA